VVVPVTVPAHQLAVLPFMRGRLPGSALLMGSALPDLAFPVGGYWLNMHSHLWYGPAFMSLTIGVLLYVWCERLFAPALVRSLPPVAARLFRTRGLPGDVGGWARAVAAILIGAYSHLLFDGFTHYWMWPSRWLWPKTVLIELPGYTTDFAHFLQLACSLVGSIWVVVWAVRLARRCPPVAHELVDGWARRLRRGILATLAGAALGLAFGLLVWGVPSRNPQIIFIAAGPVAVGGFLGASLACWRARRAHPVLAPSHSERLRTP
jgi:hypothetical protein